MSLQDDLYLVNRACYGMEQAKKHWDLFRDHWANYPESMTQLPKAMKTAIVNRCLFQERVAFEQIALIKTAYDLLFDGAGPLIEMDNEVLEEDQEEDQ